MKPSKKIIIAGILVAADLCVWGFVIFSKSPGLSLYFIDVGQGDSELISFPGGVRILIDGGPDGRVVRELGKVLPFSERYIDLIALTHPEADHLTGLIEVLKRYRAGAVLMTGRVKDTPNWHEFSNILKERQIPVVLAGEGDKISYKGNTFTFLSPGPQFLSSAALNDSALAGIFESASGVRALFTGDLGKDVEKALIGKYDLRADILKVGHHGSKTSTSEEFLKAVNPEVSLIEVGAGNRYGHPTAEVLQRLNRIGSRIFRTDLDGTIRIDMDGAALKIKKHL